jgi:hypothetical protein
MTHQGKQMRVGAREGFAYHSVKPVLLVNGDRVTGMRLIPFSSIFFIVVKALYPFEVLLCPISDL